VKVLVAVDGSNGALNAVKNLINHVDWYRQKPRVDLVYVNLPLPQPAWMSAVVSQKQIEAYYREEGESALAEARKLLDAARIEHDDHILVGQIADTIVELAASRDCAFIAMGTHGRTEAGNILLGSIATRVLHSSRLPVLLVK